MTNRPSLPGGTWTRRLLIAVVLALVAAAASACATREARIRADQERFDAYPEDVQRVIRAGQIEVGFTEEMVMLALGPPDAVRRRVDAQGETTIWAYRSLQPSVGIGIGGGRYGPFGGIGMHRDGELRDETIVTLEEGVVVEIEYLE